MNRFITHLLLAFCFLCCSFFVLYYHNLPRERALEERARSLPMIEAQGLVLRRYEGSAPVLQLKANKALLWGGKRASLYGKVWVWRALEGEEQTLRSKEATLFFAARHREDFWKKGSFRQAEFRGNAKLSLGGGETLETSVVKYDNISESFFGDQRSLVSGEGYRLQTENGFHYRIKEQLLQVSGYVEGSSLL